MEQSVWSGAIDRVAALIHGADGPVVANSGHDVLADDDQLLVAELQARPRAPWTDIGGALGISGTTASRRWNRLVTDGYAWITAYPAQLFPVTGYVWITVSPRRRRHVGATITAHPATYWVDQLDGERTFLAGVAATSLRGIEATATEIAEIDGVMDVHLQLCRSVMHDGTVWQPKLAGPVDQEHPTIWRARETGDVARPSETDIRLFRALMRDGRATYTELATATGLSDRTVRRRLPELLENRMLSTRCDVSRETLGMESGFFLSIRWTARWRSLIGVACRMPGARLVAGVSGASPFLLQFWGRSIADADMVVARLEAAVPDLHIDRIDYSVRSLKRFGRYLGPDGRVADDALAPDVDLFDYAHLADRPT